MNKKILLSLLIIGVVASVAGAGTWAIMEDPEQAAATMTAGTLNLQVYDPTTNLYVDSVNSPVAVANIANVAPGASGSFIVHVKNTGSLPGELTITEMKAVGISGDYENSEAELVAEGNPISGESELDDEVDVSSEFTEATLLPNGALAVTITYYVHEDATSAIQGDAASLQVTFNLKTEI